MAWVRLDDRFDENPKLQLVGPVGLACWVCGLAYCNRNLTDGFIPWGVARKLVSVQFLGPGSGRVWETNLTSGVGGLGGQETVSETLGMLVSAGLWDECDGGYKVHDYHEYQPSRERVLRERDRNKRRQKGFRDHRGRNAVSNAVSNGGVTAAPYPVSVPEESKDSVADATAPAVAGSERVARAVPKKRVDGYTEHPEFVAFYAAYPRRTHRREAVRAFNAAIKRHASTTDPDDVTAAARSFAARCQNEAKEERFIPHPASWLNADAFLEEFTDG